MKCKRCGVLIMDDTDVCPLCHSVLGQEGQNGLSMYPDVAAKRRRWQHAFRIIIFLAVMIEIVSIVVNYYTSPNIHWALVTGIAMIYVIFSLWSIVNSHHGHVKKLYYQIVGMILLLVALDNALGYKGWSVEYGLPCVILVFDAVIVLCMIINRANWEYYLLVQVFAVILSVINMILYLRHVTDNAVLAWVTLDISAFLCAGSIVIGGRRAENELKRKFHL